MTMKKIYLLLVLLTATTIANAAIVVITVTSNQFSPANVTVVVGDVVAERNVDQASDVRGSLHLLLCLEQYGDVLSTELR